MTPREALFTRRRGDDWRWRFQVTSGDVSGWDAGTLLVQIRTGTTETGTLVASSDEDDEVILIDTTGTDLEADPAVFEMFVDNADTDDAVFTAGSVFTLHATIEIDTDRVTIMHERLIVTDRSAVTV